MMSTIFLNGPIGVGKTRLGRALAARLGGAFIDSDDLRDYSKSWIGEFLTGSRKLVQAS
jgi:shikimate kinase